MDAVEALQRVGELRNTYGSATAALPWLDACRDEDDPPAFPTYATDLRLPAVQQSADLFKLSDQYGWSHIPSPCIRPRSGAARPHFVTLTFSGNLTIFRLDT